MSRTHNSVWSDCFQGSLIRQFPPHLHCRGETRTFAERTAFGFASVSVAHNAKLPTMWSKATRAWWICTRQSHHRANRTRCRGCQYASPRLRTVFWCAPSGAPPYHARIASPKYPRCNYTYGLYLHKCYGSSSTSRNCLCGGNARATDAIVSDMS